MDLILAELLAKFPVLAGVFAAVGALIVLAGIVIKLTPSKADDEALAHIKAIPLVGGLLAWLVGKSPIKEG